ncbi:MAG: purine-binding chemotaxis protein CheW [Deltaproteobacteria bacterium]|nr:purine-binding chemotaxis protein CheW [Deltaproteobacteria bacterium]
MEKSRAALEHGLQPTTEEKNKTLKHRAQMLAVESKDNEAAEEYIEVVEFVLAHERYAIASQYVREVYPLVELTPIPCTPAFVLGIINVRGRILSVIDIKRFFDLPEKGLTDLNKVIILHSDDMDIGILADAVLGTHNVRLSELQAALPTLTGIREQYLKGVTKERVVVMDAARLLSDKNIIVHENV